jgi:catechol 2,3-dioxygenase-like lactoylglutathione lyase family enzyme
MVRVLGLDHIVLRCVDVETTLWWYVERLGLEPVRIDEWRAGDAPFPSVRVDRTTIIDFFPAGGKELLAGFPGNDRLDHVCLVVDEVSIQHVIVDPRFDVVSGPAPRFGAQGIATSVYLEDPDGLVVELRAYPT